ncbi:hypothetical protein ABEP17_06130, partial [Priestia flexa]|uniref:hypothetical protein n=1 Tax=Priestia flexa TaxID=86664 RepID=UPI003D2AB895
MKKILLFTVAALLATFFIDRAYSERNQAQLESQLVDEINKTKEETKSDYAVIDFNELFDFNWDEVYVFGPEASVKDVNKELGFKWSDATLNSVLNSQENVVVFVENKQITQYIKVPVDYGTIIPKESVVKKRLGH